METLNSCYINIAGTSFLQPPQTTGNPKDQANSIALVDAIISSYKIHPSLNQIRKKCPNPKLYSCPDAKKEDIDILIKRLNRKNATGPDGISQKIKKLSADFIDKHPTNIINTDLECLCFSENAKPIYKKESRSDKNQYRTVSILNGFQRFMNVL